MAKEKKKKAKSLSFCSWSLSDTSAITLLPVHTSLSAVPCAPQALTYLRAFAPAVPSSCQVLALQVSLFPSAPVSPLQIGFSGHHG